MLLELRIENLLLIERAELRLGAGLNAITGETGAGKTVLAHSLDLLLGGKARPQIVRPGAAEAWVEGVFALPPGLLDDPELAAVAERLPDGAEEVVLGRRIGASGRTSAFVGGRAASAADLQSLGGRLLAFYGQHEHRRLMLASAQLEILDGFAGGAQLERRDAYRATHAEVKRLDGELAELRAREGVRERDLDLLQFELSEIDAAEPDAAEAEELETERGRLRHAESLRVAAARALGAISGEAEDGGGARQTLGEADAELTATEGVDPGLDALAERTRSVALELDDLAAELRGYLEGIEAEPGGSSGSRSALTRSSGSSASTAARSRRFSPMRRRAAPRSSGSRTAPRSQQRSSADSPRRPPSGRPSPRSSARVAARPPVGSRSGWPRSSQSWRWRGHGSRSRSTRTLTASDRSAPRPSSSW